MIKHELLKKFLPSDVVTWVDNLYENDYATVFLRKDDNVYEAKFNPGNHSVAFYLESGKGHDIKEIYIPDQELDLREAKVIGAVVSQYSFNSSTTSDTINCYFYSWNKDDSWALDYICPEDLKETGYDYEHKYENWGYSELHPGKIGLGNDISKVYFEKLNSFAAVESVSLATD